MEMAGLGKLSPNMMMIGFQEKWFTCSDDANDFVKTLQAAFDLHLSVGVLRVQGGLDLSSMGLTKVLDNIGYHIFVSKARESMWYWIDRWLEDLFYSCQTFLSLISTPTGFLHWGLVTRWAQLLIT